jgi:hypothetical protein
MVPDDIRLRHPELVALSKPVLPARLIGELRKVIGAFAAHPSHGRSMQPSRQPLTDRS